MSAVPAGKRMTAAEFLAWAVERPDGERYELVGGEVVAMSPQRSAHALTKARIWRSLDAGLRARGLPCTAYPDGMAVRVDEATVYEPDAFVRCGPSLPGEAIEVTDPVIIVEVLSPSTRSRDAGGKLADYFRLPSVRHYLIVDAGSRTVIHHRRDAGETILTRILRDGDIELEPPGITVAIPEFFA
jgi:Uma2 family endonuclease